MKRQNGNAINQLLINLAILIFVSVLVMTGITAVVYHSMKVDAEQKAQTASSSLVVSAPIYPSGSPNRHE